MAVSSEGRYAGEFLASEAPGSRSRENITVLSGQNLVAGTVVGRVKRGVGGLTIPTVVGTGNGTMSALFAGPDVEVGNYVVKLKTVVENGGVFSVTTPSGKALPDLTLSPGAGNTTAYRSSHINFSITDGATDFALNDTFTIAVAAGTTAPVVGTGNGTVTGISLGPDARPGRYRVEITGAVTNGGVVQVIGPDGDVVAASSIAAGAGGTLVLADQRQINLTVTDGSTDFAKGDSAEIVVFNIPTAKVVEWDPTPASYDGRHEVAGVALDNYDATAGDLPGVIVARDAEVVKEELTWISGATTAEIDQGVAGLAALGIIARTGL